MSILRRNTLCHSCLFSQIFHVSVEIACQKNLFEQAPCTIGAYQSFFTDTMIKKSQMENLTVMGEIGLEAGLFRENSEGVRLVTTSILIHMARHYFIPLPVSCLRRLRLAVWRRVPQAAIYTSITHNGHQILIPLLLEHSHILGW